jgi:predicted metal-dependent phosphoesterase TrpH
VRREKWMKGVFIMAMYSEVGSLWHRWDLHVHTSASYDYAYKNDDADEKLVEALHNHKISAVAITDHFQIDAVKIQNLRDIVERKNYEITFFPGVELRTDKGANNLHIILIFSDTSDVFNLSNLFNVNLKSNLHKESDPDETIHWDFETILKFAKQHNAIISIHAGSKSNGIDQIKCSNALPVNEAIKDEGKLQVEFEQL